MAKQFQDRFFSVRLSRDEKKVKIALLGITLLLLLLLANMFYLTIQSMKGEKPALPTSLPLASPSATLTPTSTPTPLPVRLPVQQAVPAASSNAVKEYFVSFGGGTNQTDDWVDVPGATATIDFGSYSNIKAVHFEASVSIPTANETASVRLFNETDKHPVWYSEITLTDGQFVSSNPVVYDVGSKLYQVQMKTSLKFLANLVQSRVHIILQ